MYRRNENTKEAKRAGRISERIKKHNEAMEVLREIRLEQTPVGNRIVE